MKYKQLGNSGLIVSELCFGAMTFGSGDYYGFKFTVDQNAANEMVGKVLDRGVNFFDTAVSYANGESEIMLGKALGNHRKDVLISTKISIRHKEQPFRAGTNLKNLTESTNESLQRLGTDYIDVLLLHNDDPLTPPDEVVNALETLIRQGKVLYIGLSNFQGWKAATLVEMQKSLGYHRFIASQMHYSLLNREVEHEFIPMSLHHGLGMMVWSPLSSGFLTGKYTRENPHPEDARLNTFDLGLFDREKAYDVVDKVQEIASGRNVSPITVSLAWLLAKPVVSTVIIGSSKLSQLEDNLSAAGFDLTSEEIAHLDKLTEPEMRYPRTFVNLQDAVLKSATPFGC
jgi:aryl-alcohol dehydrogenase-like predicted oxidoreductase